jgi:hypothetical protein
MIRLLPTAMGKFCRMSVLVAMGFAIGFASPEVSWAKPKTGVAYKECACICQAPGDALGVITDIRNTGGFSCGAYNGKTCNYTDPATGGVRTGTTKNCGGFKPGGTISFKAPTAEIGSILRRGIEGQQPAEGEERGEMIITVPAE